MATENVATETLPTAVDPNQTILFKGGVSVSDEGDRPSHTNIMVSLTDATTITFERNDSHNAEEDRFKTPRLTFSPDGR